MSAFSSCSKLGNSVWRIYWEVWVSPSQPSHTSPSLWWGRQKAITDTAMCRPGVQPLSPADCLALNAAKTGKHQKLERWIKRGQISACVHGLRACMSACVFIYKYIGACARVRVCMQRPQHGIGYLPWLFPTICPEVGSLDEAELGYFLPHCSVDPWTLDYTWATIFICLAFEWALQIWTVILGLGQQVLWPSRCPRSICFKTEKLARLPRWLKGHLRSSLTDCVWFLRPKKWSKRTNFC